MPGTISQYQVVIPGQVITATLWNGMELNIINNGLIWSGIDDYSATDAEMRIATDPFPGSVTSRPTSAQGELERIRFQLANITGKTYWYEDPDQAIPSLITSIAAVIPSGTKMAFYQASVNRMDSCCSERQVHACCHWWDHWRNKRWNCRSVNLFGPYTYRSKPYP